MSIFINDPKILIIDSQTSPLLPKAVISPYITTPLTNSLVTVTPNPDFKPFYTTPLLPQYNLNYDTDVHENVTSSIYRKIFNSWLYKSDFEDLFKYIKIVNGEAKLSLEKDGNNYNDSRTIEKKIRFIKDYILSRKRVKKIIEEFVYGTKTNWYDVEKNSYYVKDLIYRYMKKKLKALIQIKKNKSTN